MKNIPLIACTQQQFSSQIHDRLGRGVQQASICYRDYFRRGEFNGGDPAFANCPKLFDEIVAASDLSLPEVTTVREEGETRKFLLRTADNFDVEAVLLPMQAGGTLCVSSQVGCRLGCRFCETGRMGLLRNLSVEEIVAQVFVARNRMDFEVRNIVFMGMGEPLDNFEAVSQAIRVLKDPAGFGYGRRSITVSTSGCVDQMDRIPELGVNLAVSINAPNDAVRDRLMPINRKYPMAELRKAMERYCAATKRQILGAYVLIGGVTDALEHADELADYVRGLDIKINVIPYNPQSKHGMQRPADEQVDAFMERLRFHGLPTLLRRTKGRDIMAACGQLGNVEIRSLAKRAL